MSQRARIADGFTRQSAEQLITMAGTIINGLTGNSQAKKGRGFSRMRAVKIRVT